MENYNQKLENKLGFDRVRDAVAARCMTQYARDRVYAELFSTKEKEILSRLRLTDEMRLICMFEESFPQSGFIDCLDFLLPLERFDAAIDLLSLRKLRTMLQTLNKVTSFFFAIKDGIYPCLKRMSASVSRFPEIEERIDGIIDRYGQVKDTASDELYEIRRELREKESAIARRAAAVLRRAQAEGIASEDAAVTVRDGKMLIPVSAADKKKLSGFIYDESASGKTAFIEPAELVQLDNEISQLRFDERREILRILMAFTDALRPELPTLADAARYMGEIDFLMAKARLALDYRAGMPLISREGTIHLRKARHPLLEEALKKEGKEIVPLTLSLTPQKHILLISGPNAGGKSVCLKTMGLLQYMFQWGMLIPTSESSELCVFRKIMVSIGDDQSLDNDLSTYSSFLAEMKTMLLSAGSDTLILIDEFGSGTEPAAGGAIAEALLSRFDQAKSYGVITTHYTNLKLYASAPDSGVVNGAMAFDTQQIASLFKLEMGLPGNSFAFELARKMGLPEEVVKDAEKRAGEEFVGMERNLRKIERSRRALDEKLERIRTTDKTLENITDRYRSELQDIKQTRKEILDAARKEAESIVKGANKEIENTIRAIKESQAEKTQTQKARSGLSEFMQALALRKEEEQKAKDDYIEKKIAQIDARKERERQRKALRAGQRKEQQEKELAQQQEQMQAFRNAPLQVGEKVRVKSNSMVGEVIEAGRKTVTVAVGSITSRLKTQEVERITANEYKALSKPAKQDYQSIRVDENIRQRKLEFKMELDVRGERLNDALDKVTQYIDDAIMLGVSHVRIIHGKGTGVLHEEIQKMLRVMPGVEQVADEHIELGGSGVTLVKLS